MAKDAEAAHIAAGGAVKDKMAQDEREPTKVCCAVTFQL